MRLSALAIRNAKPRETSYKLGDGGGLYLLIKPNSSRLWRMNYAYKGRQKTLSLVLRRIEGAGHYESARCMRSVISRVFRYGIATARADRDVAVDLRGALVTPKVKHLAAITNPADAGALMRAIAGYTGHAVTRIALEMSAHVFVRPGEPRQAERTEFDLDRALWVLPAEKMKMRRLHRVPLSRQVLALLNELKLHTGHGRYWNADAIER